MEAVKMSNTSQVKSQIRTASADMPKGGDEFMKLLQVKKDQVQPDKGETKQTESKDTSKGTDDVSEDKKDGVEDTEDSKVSSEDVSEEDALLQAAMQQTAAQMAGILSDSGEKTTQAAGDTARETEALTETKTEPLEAVREPEKTETEPVRRQDETDASGEKEAGQGESSSPRELASERVQEKAPEIQPQKSQTEKVSQEKTETDSKLGGQESLYGTASSKTESPQDFAVQKQEQIPLKTSESQLPQDLGKTLADRFPGTGRELIVELEPANLGKLTIKMAYEAGRAAISIMASNPKTLELLNQKAAEIASILEEKTGEETIIYTHAPEQESKEEDSNPNQNGQGYEGRQERHETSQENRHETESFAQQLRLGLV